MAKRKPARMLYRTWRCKDCKTEFYSKRVKDSHRHAPHFCTQCDGEEFDLKLYMGRPPMPRWEQYV